MAELQGRYAVIDTTLTKTNSTVIDALSGRQGDDGRVVYFAIKDGEFPHNLVGQDVSLRVRDAANKVKVVQGIYETISAEGGLFSMFIPGEVYRAAGDVKEAYLTVEDGNITVSTIPIAFTVFANGIVISANASKDYLSSVDKVISEVKGKIDDLRDYFNTLKNLINGLTDLVNKNKVATLNGNNTFENDVTVKGKLKADLTGNAQSATTAQKFDGHSYADALGHDAFRRGTRFFAHRGAQLIAPENSLPALRKVSNHSGIEIDVHQTKDGRWVVMHDGNIDRMTNKKGAISSYNFTALRDIHLSKGSAVSEFTEDELVIPTLEEALVIAKDKRLTPVIEIKKDSTDNYTSASYDSLVAIIKKFNIEKEMIFISFDYNSLVEVKKRLPLVEVSYLTSDITTDLIDQCVALGENAGIDSNYAGKNVNAANIQKAHNAGLKVGVWTTNDDSNRETLLNMGVDFITTNSLSGELRFAKLTYQNGWKNFDGDVYSRSYVTEIAPGKIQLRFLTSGGKRTKGTVFATLPSWAQATDQVWTSALVRKKTGGDGVIHGTFDISGNHLGELLVGYNWNSESDKTAWVAGDVVYYI